MTCKINTVHLIHNYKTSENLVLKMSDYIDEFHKNISVIASAPVISDIFKKIINNCYVEIDQIEFKTADQKMLYKITLAENSKTDYKVAITAIGNSAGKYSIERGDDSLLVHVSCPTSIIQHLKNNKMNYSLFSLDDYCEIENESETQAREGICLDDSFECEELFCDPIADYVTINMNGNFYFNF